MFQQGQILVHSTLTRQHQDGIMVKNLMQDFYEESDPEVQYEFLEGFLLHNLEHGYIMFWYNCDLLDGVSCSNLKSQIKGIMDEFNNSKVIRYPRSPIDIPLVMTSWERMLPLDPFIADEASDFIRRNRNRAPEPNAP